MRYDHRKNSPDYAKMYYRATNHSILNLIEGGMSDDDIRLQFRKVYLKPPSHSYLKWYREIFKNPASMVEHINTEFTDFLTSKLGIGQMSADRILDTIMMVGLAKLREKEDVTVGELIKAIQIRKQYSGGAPPGDMQKQIDDLLSGHDENLEEIPQLQASNEKAANASTNNNSNDSNTADSKSSE